MLDDVEKVVLGKRVERQPQAKPVRQRNLVFHRLAGMQFTVDAFPVFVIAFLFRHQVATVGRGVQQHVIRCLFQRAIEYTFQHPVVTLA
ncbi:hypothetical protein D3C80_1520760 [compost metagenome]